VQVCEPLRAHGDKQQREMDNAAHKLGVLFWQLNAQQLSGTVLALLADLSAAVARGAWHDAQQLHIKLTGSHWDECKEWLGAIKRLIKARQAFQG
jgi:Steroid receptor RNA activator (SRA1)